MRALSCLVLALIPAGCASSGPEADLDIGPFHRSITTQVDAAQRWFDRGLLMSYGFNHEEAIRCFERAAEADPDCAMAFWGIAYASGPNINNMEMDAAARERAYRASHRAMLLAAALPDAERALIHALSLRYPSPDLVDRDRVNQLYAAAMRSVYRQHPDDPDVAAVFAEALMVLRPWQLFAKDGTPAPETPEIVEVLESGLASAPDHPGLCHFYVHTMEASPQPERALAAADQLRDYAPGAGHLLHMPSHIDVLLGRYPEAILANQKAIAADLAWADRHGRENFYTLYRAHNYHFLVYGAMFDGQSELARRTARELVEQIPPDMLVEWADLLDAFVPTELHVMVRFGQWQEILQQPEPAEPLFFTRAIYRYARTVALAALGRADEAAAEFVHLEQAIAECPSTRLLFNNTGSDILEIARAMAAGEVAYRQGDKQQAFTQLRRAVERDDQLNYDEPWGWMQPARHALGALLLEDGEVAEAEAVYREDLRRHPDNAWALHGLAECMRRVGQDQEAAALTRRAEEAWVRADVELRASCLCRPD